MHIPSQAFPRQTGIPARTAKAAFLRLFAAFSLIGLTGLAGCKQKETKATVLAQVGNATLTLEELRESFPAEYEQLIRREQYLDFIKRWMDDEAVYQQALQSKLEKDPVVGRKLEKLRRKLLIEEFLARENATEVFEPDEMAMNQYYEMHKEDFRRKAPEFKFAHMRVQTYKQAMDLRGKVGRGDFLALATANSLDPSPESYSSIPFKKQSEIPPCLSQEIASVGIGAVTLPVACADGFYLVKVLEKQDAGSLVPFAEAKEEISGILSMERKDKLQEARIAKYKEGLAVSFNLDQVPGVTEAPKDAGEPAAPPAAPAIAPAKPSQANAPKTPAVTAAAVPPAAAARLPREPAAPAAASASPAATSAQPAPAVPSDPAAAADPRLPREPWQDKNAAKSRAAARKHGSRAKAAPDSSETKAAAPKAPADPATETTGQKPDAEENTNAPKPVETP
jgi:parvulin-like peptidyl-prolyl isomerase